MDANEHARMAAQKLRKMQETMGAVEYLKSLAEAHELLAVYHAELAGAHPRYSSAAKVLSDEAAHLRQTFVE
jgi:hypothetical protein